MSSNNRQVLSTTAVVINDDATQLSVLAALLSKSGLDVMTFERADAALSTMEAANPPRLIVTDLSMPGMDGWRFCRLLRTPEYASFNQVPILIVSATFAGDEAARIAADIGAEAFIPSPIDGRLFLDQVGAILNGKRMRQPVRVLIVDGNKRQGEKLKKTFSAGGYQADVALTPSASLDAFSRRTYDIAVLDDNLPDGRCDNLLDAFRIQRADCVCLVLTAEPTPELALDWMKRGAAAYLKKPFQPDELISLCSRTRRERDLLRVKDLLEVRTLELRESEARYRRLFESSSDALFLISDNTGRVMEANRVASDLYGYARAELLAMKVADLSADPERTGRRENATPAMCEHGMNIPQCYHRKKDGTHFPVEVTVRSFSLKGQPVILVAVRDITRRRKAEAERDTLEAQLIQSQKMEAVGQLAGGVAHDFNNILQAISGFGYLLEKKITGNTAGLQYVAEIMHATDRAMALTQSLLAFSRKQHSNRQPMDLNAAIRQTEKMLSRTISEDIYLSLQLTEQNTTVLADGNQIVQILMNLSTNARDSMQNGGMITLATDRIVIDDSFMKMHGHESSRDYVVLSVSDSGAGMDAATRERIFEPFFTTKEIGKGTGLGLSMVYGIVKQHNGFLEVSSEPGMGSTFKVYLPAHETKAGVREMADESFEPEEAEETILLVEDDAMLRRALTPILQEFGHTVIEACNGDDAVAKFLQYRDHIRLVLMDVIMPVRNGGDAYQILRSIRPDIKVIFMSGYAGDYLSHKVHMDDGVHIISKPVSPKKLYEHIRRVLNEAPVVEHG